MTGTSSVKNARSAPAEARLPFCRHRPSPPPPGVRYARSSWPACRGVAAGWDSECLPDVPGGSGWRLVSLALIGDQLVMAVSALRPKGVIEMAGMLKVSRSRGALSGVLLVLLGIWGGLIPLVGPYVHYAYTPDHAWKMTSGRVWLEFLPAAGTFVGGLVLLASRLRPMALLGGSLAVISGAWFAVGNALAPLWTNNLHAQGFPVGSHIAKAMEQIGFFPGLGVAIVCIASIALGRLSLVSVRDASVVEPEMATAPAA